MGRVEWFSAEILLPAAAVPAVKRALTAATNQLHDTARAAAKDFWVNYAKRTRSPQLYEQRLDEYIRATERASSRSFYSTGVHVSGLEHPHTETLFSMLAAAAQRPHQLTVPEVAAYFPKATNRATVWAPGIGLDGRKLTFGMGEGKNVREEFATHPVGAALYTALSKVKWTRGTGGHSWGSDEYAEDAAREYGTNPVSTLQTWGPLGEQTVEAESRALAASVGLARSRR